ncbi:hypothetical protein [Nioella aestuarii]|uniref:hypothetical protein n=1 Tax=Nioella aestuarii TaxID=1662864 RepID=UPI003D7F36CD
MPRPNRRQLLFLPALLWTLPATADLIPTHPATSTVLPMQTGITPGTYLGQWSDGSDLRNILRVIGPDMITLQRQGYSSPPVPYQRVAEDRFQSGTGHTVTMLSPTRLRWTSPGGISVIYDLQ